MIEVKAVIVSRGAVAVGHSLGRFTLLVASLLLTVEQCVAQSGHLLTVGLIYRGAP